MVLDQVEESREAKTANSSEHVKIEGELRDLPFDLLWVAHQRTQDKPVTQGRVRVLANLCRHPLVPTECLVLEETSQISQVREL